MENGQLSLEDKRAVVWLSREQPSNPSVLNIYLLALADLTFLGLLYL